MTFLLYDNGFRVSYPVRLQPLSNSIKADTGRSKIARRVHFAMHTNTGFSLVIKGTTSPTTAKHKTKRRHSIRIFVYEYLATQINPTDDIFRRTKRKTKSVTQKTRPITTRVQKNSVAKSFFIDETVNFRLGRASTEIKKNVRLSIFRNITF